MLILAHRGAHAPETPGSRENTVEAFVAAAELGVDGVELDVRRTADGALVVHHDPLLDDGRAIAATPAGELPRWLPSLAAALEACGDLALVDVEIKNSPLEAGFDATPGLGRQVASAVGDRGDRHDNILVTSFDITVLMACREAMPELRTGWLTGSGYDQLDAIATASSGGHQALAPPEAVTTLELVERAHGAGLQIVVWTVDEPSRLVALAAMGVDAAVTDRPGLAVAIRG